MDINRKATTTRSDQLHDAVNNLVSTVFATESAHEQLQQAFPTSAISKDAAAVDRVLLQFVDKIKSNLKEKVSAWIQHHDLARRFNAMDTSITYKATLEGNENSLSNSNAPQVDRPNEMLAHVVSDHQQQLQKLTSALAEREARLEDLRGELRLHIDQASDLCRQLDTLSESAPRLS